MTDFTVSYTISRADPSPSDPPTSDTFSFPLDSSSPHAHLVSLEKALGDARAQMNGRLTEWKEALKDVEKPLKKSKKQKAEEEEEDEEEDEELDG
ncbi:hypothetical protein JCM10908_002383 [Rhodotorula pacifica]|uniref:uncharacterized protein n=1 Tax=Rhodotorula pacifica TaxID=1495444 RepID=UPI0031757569